MVQNNLHVEKRTLRVPPSMGTAMGNALLSFPLHGSGKGFSGGCLLCGGRDLSARVIWTVLGGALWLSL